ncbi:MAG: acetyltransferase [Pseudomonadota bacterium]
MYLKHKPSGDLVEVLDVNSLVDPFRDKVAARFHSGEELQDPATFEKADLLFPSGEGLPRCWIDSNYRQR